MSRAEKDRRYRLAHADEVRARQAAWRDANAVQQKAKHTRRRLEKRAMCLVAAARVRARAKGVAFAITAADVAALQATIDAGRCEVSGVAFTLTGPRSATSPSLDRMTPARGYVSGNLRVVCHALNAGMGDWGEAELLRIARAWVIRAAAGAMT